MPSEAGAIIFYDQNFGGCDIPEGGDDVSEATRLRAVPIGVYELSFRQQPQYEFSGAFLFNGAVPEPQRYEQQKQFDVLEDTAGTERTLMIQTAGDGINLDSVEMIPLDWRQNPLEFTRLADGEGERTIRYRKDPPPESLKLKVSGLNVFEVEMINAALWVNGRDYLPGKQATFIRRSEDIRIDRLDNSSGGTRKIEEHLLTFFRILLEKAPDRTFDLECSYRYQLVAGGPHALLPVLVPQTLTLSTTSELFAALLPALNNWYQSSSPPKGVFDFGVKVYGAGSRQSLPNLHLTGIILPIESIAGWSEAPAS